MVVIRGTTVCVRKDTELQRYLKICLKKSLQCIANICHCLDQIITPQTNVSHPNPRRKKQSWQLDFSLSPLVCKGTGKVI